MKTFVSLVALTAGFGLAGAAPAQAQFKTQGVTDTEIVIGTHQPLSGPSRLRVQALLQRARHLRAYHLPPRLNLAHTLLAVP